MKQKRAHKIVDDTEPTALDLGRVVKFLGRVDTKTWVAVLLVLIPLFLAVYFRAYPASLPITDKWAYDSVDRAIMSQQVASLKQSFPNLPPENLNAQARELADKLESQQRDQFELQVKKTSQYFKSRMKNDKGETYLLAIDPYFYYMNALSVLKYGHVGNTLKDGKPWDTRIMAPVGAPIKPNFHTYVMIIIWKILKIFNSGLDLMGGAFWVPVIIASLSVIPAFFIVRRRAGNLGGFIAATLVGVHSAFLGRTPGGFADTDSYNVLFPLLISWLLIEAFENKDLWKKATFAGLSGLALGIYSRFWTGFWYILDIILGVFIAYYFFQGLKFFFRKRRSKSRVAFLSSDEFLVMRRGLVPVLSFLLVSGLMVSLLLSPGVFFRAPLNAIGFTQLKEAALPSLWPNVLTTVAELNEVSFSGVIANMGGKFLYALALLGLLASLLPKRLKPKDAWFISFGFLMTLYLVSKNALGQNFLFKILTSLGFVPSNTLNSLTYLFLVLLPPMLGLFMLVKDDRKVDVAYSLILLLWFVGAMYATTKGIRFTLVMVPPLGVAIGTLMGVLYHHLKDYLAKELDIPLKILKPVLIILLCLVLFAPIRNAHAVALNEVPSMNDAWYDSLAGIKSSTSEDAIITSWWDFGHWFKAIADRGVTFDGGSQATPMAHWVGKLLLEGNENNSVSILRMLDCGSYKAYDLINDRIKEPILAKRLLDKMLLTDRDGAEVLLRDAGITDADTIDEILGKTHCEPPEGVLITSTDMIGKSGVWGHFGLWDFDKAYIYNNLRMLPEEEAVSKLNDIGYDDEEASSLYFQANSLINDRDVNNWIAPWPGFVSQSWIGCEMQNVTVNMSAFYKDNNVADSNVADVVADDSGMVSKKLAICPTNLRVGSQNGIDVVIEAIIIDPENPKYSRLRYGFYNGGVKSGQNDNGKPAVLFYAHKDISGPSGLEKISVEGANSGVGFLYDEQNNRVLAADPNLVGSLFTQLFFLDGRFNSRFEKLSDKTSFNGQRIVVWRVLWDNGTQE